MKRKFKLNIYDYLEINRLNDLVDEQVNYKEEKEGIASDIVYTIKDLKENGDCIMEANFYLDNYAEFIINTYSFRNNYNSNML